MNSKASKSAKTGRKGDPRMHKAVAARLAHPGLSLFEALRLGGFEYATDEDASVIDSEKVTLAQRKNQLSRRLRFARKHHEGHDGAMNVIGVSGIGGPRSNIAPTTPAMSTEAQKQLEKLMQHSQQAKINSGVKRTNAEMSADDENENQATQFQPLFSAGSPPFLGNPAGLPMVQPFFSSTMTTGLIGQPAGANNTIPSSVTVRSLTTSAQSVGLTLEQLAVTLSASSNLAKVISDTDNEKRQEVALRLYQNETRALYQKCMLLSGFHPDEAAENSQVHLEFALSAWQLEGKRLQDLMGTDGNECMDPPDVADTEGTDQQQEDQLQLQVEKEQQQQSNGMKALGNQLGHQTCFQTNCCSQGPGGCQKRHIHLLEGKCGHKAIIHQPKDGPAHIDFVVGNKVECYNGIHPVGGEAPSMWPSKYSCSEIQSMAPSQCRSCAEEADITSNAAIPKIIDVSNIDLQGKEWNSDLNGQVDGPILGLFKLGNTAKSDDSNQVLQEDEVLVTEI